MSKIKSTKRKSSSLLKSESKLSGVKTEVVVSQDKQSGNNNADSINSNESAVPSCSKNSSPKAEASVGSRYESATNVNSNRDPSDVFSSYMKNAILEEVLNAKKAALLQSPAVMKLLREEQLKKQKKN